MGKIKTSKAKGAANSRTVFDAWANNDTSTASKGRQSSLQSFFAVSKVKKRRLEPSLSARVSVSPTLKAPLISSAAASESPSPSAPPRPLKKQAASTELSAPLNPLKTPICPTIVPSKKRNKSGSFQQMYLDLGQRNFGQNICDTCGMMYIHGVQEDIKQHARVCKDWKEGVPFQASQARVVVQNKDSLIVEIRPSDSYALRQKVLQVRKIVDNELGYAPSEEATETAALRSTYLYVRKRRVVGLMTVETIEHGYALETNYERSIRPTKAMLGVHTMWVHGKFRKQGIATTLLDTARERMVYGLVIPAELVAFSSPTEAGARFAKRYVKFQAADPSSSNVLVYDCL